MFLLWSLLLAQLRSLRAFGGEISYSDTSSVTSFFKVFHVLTAGNEEVVKDPHHDGGTSCADGRNYQVKCIAAPGRAALFPLKYWGDVRYEQIVVLPIMQSHLFYIGTVDTLRKYFISTSREAVYIKNRGAILYDIGLGLQ